MTQVETEKEHGKDIKPGNDRTGESQHHHGIDIVVTERVGRHRGKARVSGAEGELQEVIDNKGEHNQPAHHHVTGSESRFYVILVLITRRSRPAVLHR